MYISKGFFLYKNNLQFHFCSSLIYNLRDHDLQGLSLSISQKIQRVLANTREDFDCTIRTIARKITGLR